MTLRKLDRNCMDRLSVLLVIILMQHSSRHFSGRNHLDSPDLAVIGQLV